MATKNIGKNTRVYTNGYDLTLFFNKASSDDIGEALDATCFDPTSLAKEYAPGQTDGKLDVEGFYAFNGAPNNDGLDEVLRAALNVADIVSVYSLGDAVGSYGWASGNIETDYAVDSPVSGLITAKASFQTKSGLESVRSLHALGAEVATGNGTAVDDGANWNGVAMPSTGGLSAFLHVMAIAGATPSLTVKIQHSADNATWADLVSFAAVVAGHQAQRVTVAGNVNRYIRCVFTLAAGTTSATFVCGYHRNN